MTATYTFDVFSSLDGYGSYDPPGDWGGYWGKQGPDLLDHRLALFGNEQRMVFGSSPKGSSPGASGRPRCERGDSPQRIPIALRKTGRRLGEELEEACSLRPRRVRHTRREARRRYDAGPSRTSP